MFTFQGGIHPTYSKTTTHKKIEEAKLPAKVILPLSQHVGIPGDSLVKVGDLVKTGQKIAESAALISAPIHASVSGVVTGIDRLPHPVTGRPFKTVTIESDGKDEKISMPNRDYTGCTREQLITIIKDAGIVGLGGAGFPAHIKLSPPAAKHIDVLVINGAECEPFLTTDHRLMIEKADELIAGIKIVRNILSAKETYFGIEKNKPEAIKVLKEKTAFENITIVSLPTKYPQGGEKPLIYSLTKRVVPGGKLPVDIGCVVMNVGTIIAIYEAVALSKPLYERVITITGKVNAPKNLLARNGTLIKELIQQAGGYKGEPDRIIMGGPMMGFSLPSDNLPIIKTSSGIVVLAREDIARKKENIDCIRCGVCVKNCPMGLHPALIAKYAEFEMIDKAESIYAMDCFECGCCAYHCPSHISLTHWIRYAKAQIQMKNSQVTKKQKL